MKKVNIGNGSLTASEIAWGCWRLHSVNPKEVPALISAALEEGIDFFDHADIYGAGRCEELFAQGFAELKVPREQVVLQSKCGIRDDYFDFSTEHILEAVDGILKRLRTDWLDVLLLHRPDALVEPEEVAAAFDKLHASGKVRHFGVSNQHPMQMELLRKYVRQPLIANQLQFGAAHTGMIDQGIYVNMRMDGSINRDGGVLDYCRLHDITIQPWSPFQYGNFEGIFLGNPKFPELNATLQKLGQKHDVSASAIAIAWILRHPAKMQPIIGTMNPQRLKEICKASEITLTRPEWYEVYQAAGNNLP